jgi:hypothetical protein
MKPPLPLVFSARPIKKSSTGLKAPNVSLPGSVAGSHFYKLDDVLSLVHQLARHRPGHLLVGAMMLDHLLHEPDGTVSFKHACAWFGTLALGPRRRGHWPVLRGHRHKKAH